jgi:ABC-2 type transport system permease protein
MRHDKRTLALMIMAPLLMLSLLYFVFNAMGSSVEIAVVNAPESYINNLEANDVYVLRYNEDDARKALEAGEVVASVNITSGKAYIEIDGSKPLDINKALMAIENAKATGMQARNDLRSEVYYLYGYEDVPTFDIYGALLIGFIIFFFVFLVAGISFLQERNGGTLEKLLSMPIKRWEIVLGYVLGFGIITVLQAFVIFLVLCLCFKDGDGRLLLIGTADRAAQCHGGSYPGHTGFNSCQQRISNDTVYSPGGHSAGIFLRHL